MSAGFTLVLGGARSGKSRFAEAAIMGLPAGAQPPVYIATAQGFDDEMRARIAQHQRDRAGAGWQTEEAPLAVAELLERLPPKAPVLLDCLTLWLTNHLLAGHDLDAETERLAMALRGHPGPIVAVANEVGFGIVPDNALSRQFRDAAGRLNQRLAFLADRVVLVVAGLPLELKST